MADRTQSIAPIVDPDQFRYKGLTKLEWMTGMVVQGLIARYGTNLQEHQVEAAVGMAAVALDAVANYEGGL